MFVLCTLSIFYSCSVGCQCFLVMVVVALERWCGDVEGWYTGLACDGRERKREMVWGCGGLVYRLGL